MSESAAQEIQKILSDTYALAEKGDYYSLLAVAKSASSSDVRRAYFTLVKKIHPDRLPQHGLSDEIERASRLFQVITNAYETLSDKKRKAEYDAGKVQGLTPSNPMQQTGASSSPRGDAAKIAFHKGTVMLNKKAYAKAEEYLREAVDRDGEDNVRYWQALGWAVFCNEEARPDAQRLSAARECFEKALEKDDEDALTHYNIGLYWKAMENMNRCRQAMTKAVECKPNFVEAKRELRLMKMRADREKLEGKNRRGKAPKKGAEADKPSDRKTRRGRSPEPPEPTGGWAKFVAFLTKPR